MREKPHKFWSTSARFRAGQIQNQKKIIKNKVIWATLAQKKENKKIGLLFFQPHCFLPCELEADLHFSLVLNSLTRWLCWRGMMARWMFVCVSYRKGSLLTSVCFFLSWLEDEYSSSSDLWKTRVVWWQPQKHLHTESNGCYFVWLLTPACLTSMWTSREANSKFSL